MHFEENTVVANSDLLVAINKGVQAVKFCSDIIRYFLTGGAG